MAKIIKFTLKKDIESNLIIFRPLWYNANHKYSKKCIHIDFKNKKISNADEWPFCRITENYFSFSFYQSVNIRETWGFNEVFRIHPYHEGYLGKDYIFPIKENENIDIMFSRIIEGFTILSNSI